MGAAAGVEVEAIDLHQTDLAAEPLGQETRPDSERLHLVDSRAADGHRTRGAYLPSHRILEPAKIVTTERPDIEFDIAHHRIPGETPLSPNRIARARPR